MWQFKCLFFVAHKSNSTAFPHARFDTLIIFAALTATILNTTLKSSKCGLNSLHASGKLGGLELSFAVILGLGGFFDRTMIFFSIGFLRTNPVSLCFFFFKETCYALIKHNNYNKCKNTSLRLPAHFSEDFSFFSYEVQQPTDPGHCLHIKGSQANKDC